MSSIWDYGRRLTSYEKNLQDMLLDRGSQFCMCGKVATEQSAHVEGSSLFGPCWPPQSYALCFSLNRPFVVLTTFLLSYLSLPWLMVSILMKIRRPPCSCSLEDLP